MAFFDDKQTGQVMSILNNDVRNLRSFLDSTVEGAIQLVVTVVGIASVLFWLNAGLALVTLVAVPLLAAFTLWFSREIRTRYRALREAVGSLNTRLEDNLSGIEVIKTAATEPYEADRVEESSRTYLDRSLDVVRLDAFYNPTMDLLAGLSFVATFVLGGYWLLVGTPPFMSGDLLVGEFVTFLFLTQRFVDPLAGVGRIVNSYENARASGERVFGLTGREVAIADRPDARPLSVRGHVEFDDVAFEYLEGTPVLSGVSFVAEPDETVALVGETGAGKSTVAKLLLRLYDVSEETVRVDGFDAREVRLADLRDAVGYVSQDVFLFDGTVRENVAYGSFDATDEEVVAAATRPTSSSSTCPTATTRASASAASSSPAGSASASQSPARCSRIPRYWSSTRRPARSTRPRNSPSSVDSPGSPRGGRRSSSPTGSRPSETPIRSSSSRRVASSSGVPTRNCSNSVVGTPLSGASRRATRPLPTCSAEIRGSRHRRASARTRPLIVPGAVAGPMSTSTDAAVVATGSDEVSTSRLSVSALARRSLMAGAVVLLSLALVRLVAGMFAPLDGVEPAAWPAVLGTGVVVTVGATVVYAALTRLLDRPDRAFAGLAAVVLLVSMIPLVVVAPTIPGVTVAVIVVLAAMHVAAALAAVATLTGRWP